MEMTPRENMMAIYEGKQPEFYGDFQWAVKMTIDPVWASDSIPKDGQPHKDSWGTVCVFPPNAPGKHPRITPDNAVVKDILNWKNELVIPTLDDKDWTKAEEFANSVDRNMYFVEYFCAQGLFERSHFLMGMEDAFCAYLEEPEAMMEMLEAIADYKMRLIKDAAYHMHPDVIFFQDDWGSKQNLFLPPDVWREMLKPIQTKIAQTIHDCGMIYVHHADCICEPIVEDMADVGIDIWQGALPQNDIVDIQRRLNGRMAIIGGIDGPAIDSTTTTDKEIMDEVHRCVDTYCPAGRFYPGAPAFLLHEPNENLMKSDLRVYGGEWAREHPIA